jgi:hypothetical protein
MMKKTLEPTNKDDDVKLREKTTMLSIFQILADVDEDLQIPLQIFHKQIYDTFGSLLNILDKGWKKIASGEQTWLLQDL